MRFQQGISLTDAQRTRIIGEMSQAQAKFTELQWTLSGEEEKFAKMLQETTLGEQAVMAQMDRILMLEQNLKRAQLLLLVRVKNVLTPEQQATLSTLQRGGTPPDGAAARGGRVGGGKAG
jgi:Spy/CpxP family protein refolding chaperone